MPYGAGYCFLYFRVMTINDIAAARLHGQMIARQKFKTPVQVVRYMGAMQAQEFAMCKWAVGLRLPKTTDAAVQQALDKGDILRTHLMRPTWHLVCAEDIHWLLELTAPHVLQLSKSHWKQRGLADDVFKKTNKLIVKALEKDSCLSRDDFRPIFEKAGFQTADNALSHYMGRAELDMLICSGPMQGSKQTYMLLDERVPERKTLAQEEALAELATRYFTAHAPATLQDFVWWTGLSVALAKKAIASIESTLKIIKAGENEYYVMKSWRMPAVKDAVYLLPAFDEYMISYKDRSAVIDPKHYKKTITSNGIFWPTVVINGKIEGLWKRVVKGDTVKVETDMFGKVSKAVKEQVQAEAARVAAFLQLELKT